MRTHRLIICALLIGCKATLPAGKGRYEEDLSVHRPAVRPASAVLSADTSKTKQSEETLASYIPLEGGLKAELDSILRIAHEQNKRGFYVDGFTLQVYSGTSREDANAQQLKMDTLHPHLNPRITYRQPSFRVRAGKFTDKLEAHRIYQQIQADFSRAILVPKRFFVKHD